MHARVRMYTLYVHRDRCTIQLQVTLLESHHWRDKAASPRRKLKTETWKTESRHVQDRWQTISSRLDSCFVDAKV